MIVWGSRGAVLDLGAPPALARPCPGCRAQATHRLTLCYRYVHLSFVFRAVNEKSYWQSCGSCGSSWRLAATRIEATLGRNPIPTFDRAGPVLVLVALAVLLIGFFFSRSS
jgi:hypothetical protein